MASVGHGFIYWNEYMTDDVTKAREFFSALLGGQFVPLVLPQGEYWLHMPEGADRPAFGIMSFEGQPDHPTNSWFQYIAVDDVNARAATVEASGGKLLRAPFEVPGVGNIAVICDPVGVVTGLIKPFEPEAGA